MRTTPDQTTTCSKSVFPSCLLHKHSLHSFSLGLGLTLAVFSPMSVAINDHDVYQHEVLCPTAQVNYWSNFALKHKDVNSIPDYLIENNCFSRTHPQDFYKAMQKRFDEPEQQQWIDELNKALPPDFAGL